MIPFGVVPDSDALAAAGAWQIAELAREAIRERRQCTLAVSGGRIAAGLFSELAAADVDWEHVHVFQVDERVAPDADPDRNASALQAHLLDRVAIPAAQVHLMPVTAPDLHAAAFEYGRRLAGVTGSVLDVVHLGLGDDGHTASWPPDDPVVDEDGVDVAVVGPYRGRMRMTLTPPPVNRARHIVWLVDGAGKSSVLRRLLARDASIPASRVPLDRATVLATAEAAGESSSAV